MNSDQLSSFFAVVLPSVAALLMKKRGITENEAISTLYNSELYADLEHEETKIWHFSAETLFLLLDEELTTGIITYPEEQ